MKEVKVAQLAGSVAELSAYHHGEVTSASHSPHLRYSAFAVIKICAVRFFHT